MMRPQFVIYHCDAGVGIVGLTFTHWQFSDNSCRISVNLRFVCKVLCPELQLLCC